MFYVSEEFLREYESGEEPVSTLEDAVPRGTPLFEATGPKVTPEEKGSSE